MNDPGFLDKVVFIDVKSFNEYSLAQSTKGVGPVGMVLLSASHSDRGVNYDFIGGIRRNRGLLAPYVYEGLACWRACCTFGLPSNACRS